MSAVLKLALSVAVLAATAAAAQAPAPYAEGQVWEYRARAGEEGSLVRIQRIEDRPAPAPGPVYHVAIVGVRLGGPGGQTDLPHLPVSRRTLDASVTRLSGRAASFPNSDEGMAEWRRAAGGVFTLPLAEIVAIVDQAVRAANAKPEQ